MLALLGVLVAGFVPHVVVGPALPESMPPFALDVAASESAHRAARRATAPAFVREALARLGDVSARRDGPAIAIASRDFADALLQAAGEDREARAALRESECDRFVARVERGPRDGFVSVALRHGVAPSGRAMTPRERAVARAWFAFRWEALGARPALRGERASLDDVLSRMIPEDRRALLSWVLDADCDALLGVPRDALSTRAQIDRCTAARREFLSVARRVDPRYPDALARAALDALEGRALRALAGRTVDDAARALLESAARDAFVRAHARYTELASVSEDRQLRRWMLGASLASAPSTP